MVGAAPPAEGRVSPVEVVVTAPSQDQLGAATVVLEGAVQSAPPGAPVGVAVTVPSQEQPDAATVVSEGVMQSVPSGA